MHLKCKHLHLGADKNEDGTLTSYVDFTNDEIVDKSVMSIKQDVKLLSEKIVKLGYRGLIDVLKKRNLSVDNIDHFLLTYYFHF